MCSVSYHPATQACTIARLKVMPARTANYSGGRRYIVSSTMTSLEARRRWEARNRQKRNLQKNVARHAHRHERNDLDRERRFRWRTRVSISRYAELGLFVGVRNDLENPFYIFEFNGQRRRERLSDRLPWGGVG